MMNCYWQRADELSTTEWMRIAESSKKACYSGKTTEKLVASNTTKLEYQSNWSVKYSRAGMEKFENTSELPR